MQARAERKAARARRDQAQRGLVARADRRLVEARARRGSHWQGVARDDLSDAVHPGAGSPEARAARTPRPSWLRPSTEGRCQQERQPTADPRRRLAIRWRPREQPAPAVARTARDPRLIALLHAANSLST